MTKEEYLISLELALSNAGVSNYEEIVEKCQALSKHALPAYDGLTLEFG